jgi:hypothetical protein
MRYAGRFRQAGCGIGAIAVALSVTCAAAQSPSPAAGCNTVPKPPTAGGASIAQAAANNVQQKNWQPRGGEVEFTLRSFVSLPPEAQVLVCFRWKTDPDGVDPYVESRPSRLDRSSDGLTLKVTTTVPNLPRFSNASGARVHNRLGFVPVADVRILILNKDNAPVADASTAIGVPSRMLALALALSIVGFAWALLYFVATWRLTHPKIRQANWMLRIIATPSGRASLSQLQIVLWTLVVAGSAVYVMAASGDLIQISNGTLVLLGIAGAAGIASKAHSQGQDAAAAAAGTPPEITTPRLSDLLMSDSSQGEVGEIDVARMQMLLFTLIAAVFVTTKVFVSFVIPDIPEGFQILMGISNAVYMGAKVAQK